MAPLHKQVCSLVMANLVPLKATSLQHMELRSMLIPLMKHQQGDVIPVNNQYCNTKTHMYML